MSDSKSLLDEALQQASQKLDFFNTKPLPHYNPSTVNEYFKNDGSGIRSSLYSSSASLASSKRTLRSQRKKENADLMHNLTQVSQKVLIQNITDYIRFYCLIQNNKVLIKDVETLIHSPVIIDLEDQSMKYGRELMVSFDFMLKTARLKPTAWLRHLIRWKGTNNQTMLFSEFNNGIQKLSAEMKLPLWEADDVFCLWEYVSNYKYSTTKHNTHAGAQSHAYNTHGNQNKGHQYILKIDLIVAFKKFALSTKKVAYYNRTAAMLRKLSEYLTTRCINIRSFLFQTTENPTIKRITMDDCDTLMSILLVDFCNAHENTKATYVGNFGNFNKNVQSLDDLASAMSDISQTSSVQQLPGYMKFGVPRKVATSSMLHVPPTNDNRPPRHLAPIHPRTQLQLAEFALQEEMRKLRDEEMMMNVPRNSVQLPKIQDHRFAHRDAFHAGQNSAINRDFDPDFGSVPRREAFRKNQRLGSTTYPALLRDVLGDPNNGTESGDSSPGGRALSRTPSAAAGLFINTQKKRSPLRGDSLRSLTQLSGSQRKTRSFRNTRASSHLSGKSFYMKQGFSLNNGESPVADDEAEADRFSEDSHYTFSEDEEDASTVGSHNSSAHGSPHNRSHRTLARMRSSKLILPGQPGYNFHRENQSHEHNIYNKQAAEKIKKKKRIILKDGKVDPNLILKHDTNLGKYQAIVDNFDRRINIAKKRLGECYTSKGL